MARESFTTSSRVLIREACAAMRVAGWVNFRVPNGGDNDQWIGRIVKIEIVQGGHEITVDRGL